MHGPMNVKKFESHNAILYQHVAVNLVTIIRVSCNEIQLVYK